MAYPTHTGIRHRELQADILSGSVVLPDPPVLPLSMAADTTTSGGSHSAAAAQGGCVPARARLPPLPLPPPPALALPPCPCP